MRGAFLLSVVASTASCVDALSLHKRDNPAVVELPLERKIVGQNLRKRGSTVNVTIPNQSQLAYGLNLTLGTPPQSFSLILDTGSSDTWVNVANSSICSATNDPCSPYGIFNASASSTYKSLDITYNATYGGGSKAYGTYATDTLGIGGTSIDGFEFAVAESSTINQGIAGVGYKISTNEAANDQKEYNNLPYALAQSGAIKSPAYSLWLNDVNANSGTILFGGVNKAKYIGELQTLPVVPVYNEYYSLALALTGVSVESSSSSNSYTDNLPLAVSLDTGTSYTALPEALANKILKDLNGTYDEKLGFSYIDCSMADQDYNVTYSFSGVKITVGIKELILNFAEPGFPTGTCALGLVPSATGLNLLGDTFLRSAYVVYDLDNNEISLANTNFNPGDDDILEIASGTNAVPGATVVPSAVSTATGNGVGTATAGALPTSIMTVTGTGSAATATGSVSGAASGSTATKTSSGLAALQTSNAKHLLSGLAGAGLLLLV